MKSGSIAWVLGAVSALTMGMAAEACSSSSTTTGTDGGSSSSSHSSGSSKTSGSSGTPFMDGGTTTLDSGVTCYKPPGSLFPEDGSTGVYCPFSGAADGGKDIHCTQGQHCCSPPESADMLSTCVAGGVACTVKDSVDWQCEGTPDCVGQAGTICCGQGIVKEQPAQPGCGSGGATVPPFPYVSGFYGSQCQASCATFGGTDGGAAFQICSKDSECESNNCIPVKPKGNGIGYCGPKSDAGSSGSGSSSSTSSASSTSGSGSSGTTSSASSTTGTTTTSSSSSSAG